MIDDDVLDEEKQEDMREKFVKYCMNSIQGSSYYPPPIQEKILKLMHELGQVGTSKASLAKSVELIDKVIMELVEDIITIDDYKAVEIFALLAADGFRINILRKHQLKKGDEEDNGGFC